MASTPPVTIPQPDPITPTKESSRPNELKSDTERAVMLQTGQVLHLDYRPNQRSDPLTRGDSPSPGSTPIPPIIRPLKAIQWNIERGIKLDSIIEILRGQDADIIALQEVDCGLSRSEYIETGIAIARELKLNYVFRNEFIELEGDIDKKYYLRQHKSSKNGQNAKTQTETTLERIANIKNDMKNGSTQGSVDRVITRDDLEYQKGYRKSSGTISTTSPRPPHDTKIQYHPTPIPTSSTHKYLEQYAVESERSGVHGNCILTRFDISSILPVSHNHHPYNWDRDGVLLNEPRIGKRQTLCCVIDIPIQFVAQNVEIIGDDGDDGDDDDDDDDSQNLVSSNNTTNTARPKTDTNHDTIFHAGHIINSKNETIQLPVYTCHFELFCGVIDRLKIFSEIFSHFRTNFGDHQYRQFQQTYGLLLGDFNTLAHSIARFSPKYCKDELRWGSLGYTEAEWWYKYILDSTQYRHLLPQSSQYFIRPDASKTEARASGQLHQDLNNYQKNYNYYHNVADFDTTTTQSQTTTPLHDLKLSKLTPADCINLINPGFEEPFDPQLETLTSYSGWFYGKLDWILTMGLHTVNTDVFNLDYLASDHRGLVFEFFLKSTPELDQRFKSNLRTVFGALQHHTKIDHQDGVVLNRPHLPLKPFIPAFLDNMFVPRVFITYPRPCRDPQNYEPIGHRPSLMINSRKSPAALQDPDPKRLQTPSNISRTSTTSSIAELNDSTGVHRVEIFSQNGYYVMHPIVRDFARGYYHSSGGLLGWIQRNYTPYLQNITAFIIPTVIAIVYILFLTGGSDGTIE